MSVLLEALRTRTPLGSIPAHRLPCPSDADPGADDLGDDEAAMLAQIEEAETALGKARELLESRNPCAMLAARSCMVEAIGHLQEAA
jgi:hypothetical protein